MRQATPPPSPGETRPDREPPGHTIVVSTQAPARQQPDMESLVAAATAEAIRQLLSSNNNTDLRTIAQSAARKAIEDQVVTRTAPLTAPTLAVDLLKDLKPARIKLLRCDDDTCEYEDLIDGAIKVKPITKKVVKLRWEEPPKNILIVKKPNDALVNGMFEDLVSWLADDLKLTVLVEPSVKAEVGSKFPQLRTWSAQEQKLLIKKVHFVICVGGDGTILWAQGLFNRTAVPPIIAFAAGSLGFLTAFEFVNHRAIIQSWISHGGYLTLRMRLQCQFLKGNSNSSSEDTELTALNEVLIDRGPSPFLTRLECYCDGVYTTTVQADGVIIATTTGSTAYSLAAGGSMVHPLVPCILFTPVCPHSLSFRPLILPDSAGLRIKVPAGTRSSAWLTCDGRSRVELTANDSVSIRMSEHSVPVVCRNDETSDWFHSVTEILRWNDRKQQKPTL